MCPRFDDSFTLMFSLIRRLSISALTTGLGVGLVNVVGLILYLRSSSGSRISLPYLRHILICSPLDCSVYHIPGRSQ